MSKIVNINNIPNEQIDEFKKSCYEKYQLKWMIDHGYSLQDIFNVCREGVFHVVETSSSVGWDFFCDEVEDYFDEVGFNGNIYACEEEFYDNEYLDENYMKSILSQKEIEFYNLIK